MNQKINLSKIIRIITVAPLMALIALSILFVCKPSIYGGTSNYILTLLFLTLLPLMAYPLQPVAPHFKDKGRAGQRYLAIVMAVVGYIAGTIFALIKKTPKELLLIFLTYLFSGVFIVIFNKVIKIKASGHACGVSGPVAYMTYFIGPAALLGLPIIAVVFWASLKTKRHTLSQLICGSVLPVAALFLSILILSI